MRAEVAYVYGGAPKNDALADEPPNQEEDAEFKDYNIVATAEKIEDAEEYLNQFYLWATINQVTCNLLETE